jgi:Fe-S-cluster containining protein
MSSADAAPRLLWDSPFSYACAACSRCCRHYLIRVNPYEVMQLARHLGLSTTAFIAQYVGSNSALIHNVDDTCIFLGPQGCGVHPARPMVCRLYPLGRHLSGDGEEHFAPMAPHPESAGVYGTAGSVGDYLRGQGALPYLDAADRYMSLFQQFYRTLANAAEQGMVLPPPEDGQGMEIPDLLDPEKAIASLFPGRSLAGLDPEGGMALHIEALSAWLAQFHAEEKRNEQED